MKIKTKAKEVEFSQIKLGDTYRSKTYENGQYTGDEVWMRTMCVTSDVEYLTHKNEYLRLINCVNFKGQLGYTYHDEIVIPINLELVEV